MIAKLNICIHNIQKYINDLKDEYNIYYNLSNLYIASKRNTSITLSDFIKKYHYDDILVTEIDEDNLKFENDKVISWCKKEFVNQDIRRFEEKNQKMMKSYMCYLDDFEKELKKISKEKRGETDGIQ